MISPNQTVISHHTLPLLTSETVSFSSTSYLLTVWQWRANANRSSTMEALPTELIHHICTHLCDHCQLPGSFPHAESWGVRRRKAALANLSAASSRLRAIAQPLLFHYFATGNMAPHGYWPDESHAELTLEFAERAKKLPLIIRSAIQRPDLAAKVKALQLVEFGATTAIASGKIGDDSNEMDVLAGCIGPKLEKTRRALPDESRRDSASWNFQAGSGSLISGRTV
ncbi:hypothetical protein N657DRAFT_692182 [Parathielavia appendiculata]|uniref:F-box domain-containing protein n=1 Tax=Parathielavia appendiculata TaxID=2587402 RepID=A0AAN6Z1M3_9PEZI|nr:hypothetical protein N657DRAFT_692182 [Parathielavia appendiculata]